MLGQALNHKGAVSEKGTDKGTLSAVWVNCDDPLPLLLFHSPSPVPAAALNPPWPFRGKLLAGGSRVSEGGKSKVLQLLWQWRWFLCEHWFIQHCNAVYPDPHTQQAWCSSAPLQKLLKAHRLSLNFASSLKYSTKHL